MSTSVEQIQIFYEIAMSIGNGLDLRSMLKASLSTYLKKLNCSAGGILNFKKNYRGWYTFEKMYSIPRNTEKLQVYQMSLKNVPSETDEKRLKEFINSLPISGHDNDNYFHIMELDNFGLIVLIKSGVDLDPLVINSLKPLNEKLSNACNACIQNEELEKSRDILLEKNIELNKSKNALQKSENKYRTIFENVQDVFFQTNKNGIITEISPSVERYLNYKRTELIGTPISEIYHNSEDFNKINEELLKNKRINDHEVRLLDKHNRVVFMSLNAHNIYDYNNVFFGIEGALRDITHRKRAETRRNAALEALRDSEERFRTIASSAQDAIIMIDNNGNISYWNAAAENIFGYTLKEAFGKELHAFIAPKKYYITYKKAFSLFRDTGKGNVIGKTIELTALKKNGKEFPVELSLSAIKIKKLWCAIAILRDISERKQAEEALRESEASLKIAQEIAIVGSWKWDLTKDEFLLSDEACNIYGITDNKSFKTPQAVIDTFIHPDDKISINRTKDEFVGSAIPKHLTFRIIRPDGETRWIMAMRPEPQGFDKDGKPKILIGTVQDVTERKILDQKINILNTELEKSIAELKRSNTELEQFAYIASHDLQEPLRKVQAFGDRLSKKYAGELSEQGRDYIERMQSSTSRMQTMINKLLTYSRISTRANPFTKVDLNLIIKTTLSDLDVLINKTGSKIITENLPTIEADEIQMNQLFTNLIGNAIKYHKKDVKPEVKIFSRKENNQILLFIKDNGIGFEEKYIDQIFQPFKRLHGRGKFEGSGIGLAICRKIIDRHNGSITAKSSPGKGSTFIVSLLSK